MTQLKYVRKAAAAVRIIDGFTGQPVEPGSVRVQMEDGGSFIRKDNGCIVFWDNGMKQRRLMVDGPYFHRESVLLDMERLARKWQPSLSVWLRPGYRYPYPAGIRLKQGEAEAGALVRLPIECTAGLIRLLGTAPARSSQRPCLDVPARSSQRPCLDVPARSSQRLRLDVPARSSQRLRLDVPDQIYMEGRTLLLRKRGNGAGEFITVWEEQSRFMGIYELEAPLAGEFQAEDTEILLTAEAFADADGQYRIPEM